MSTTPQEYNAITLRQKFPCLHLLRAFRLALDLRRLFLGAVAVLVLTLGNWLIDQLPFAPGVEGDSSNVTSIPDGKTKENPWVWETRPPNPIRSNSLGLEKFFRQSTDWRHPILAPVHSLLTPVFRIVSLNSSLNDWAYGWTGFFWALFVGVIFGGAICRQVAIEFATDRKISLSETFGFIRKFFFSYFASPLLPILGIGVFWLICFLAGLFGRIPGVGSLVIGSLYFIPLIFGILMTLLFAGFAIGYPLMVATISTEASDAFDGFSRSINYLYSRTLYYAGLAVFTLALGTLSLWIVAVSANWVTDMSAWGLKSGMGEHNTAALMEDSPVQYNSEIKNLKKDKENEEDTTVGAPMAGFWISAFNLLLHGFVVSFFWTSATIVYFLLRQSDDGTDLNEVFWEESEKTEKLFPVVEADEQRQNLDDTVDADSDEEESNPSDEKST